MSAEDINTQVEQIQTFDILKRKLAIILRSIVNCVSTNETDISSVKERLDEIESNFLDRRVVFPLGTNINYLVAVANDATQNIPDNGTIQVDFLSTLINSPYFTPNAQADVFTVNADGLYNINTQVMFNNIDSNYHHMETRILINNSLITRGRMVVQVGSDLDNSSAVASQYNVKLNAGDNIRVVVYQNNAENIVRSVNITDSLSFLNIVYAGNFDG